MEDQALEIFLTIIAGAGTFVVGQIVLKLLVDPIQSFKVTVAEVSNNLILYANIYANPREPGDLKQEQMSQSFRDLSSKLQSNMHLIPAYDLLRYVFGLPCKKEVVNAAKNLIFIHNGHDGLLANQGILNLYAAQKARLSLGIFIPEGDYLDPEKEAALVKTKSN